MVNSTWRMMVAGCLIALGLLIVLPPVAVDAQEVLVPGSTAEGMLVDGPATHSIEVSAGQLLVVAANSSVLDTTLTLFDPNGNELVMDDDGGEGSNSLLSFLTQTSGTYVVEVDSWSGGGGSYNLLATLTEPKFIGPDSPVAVGSETNEPIFMAFAGSSDMVIDVSAVSQDDTDLKLTIYDGGGAILAEDDDSGPGYDPYLRRVFLPTDGLYLIRIDGWFDEGIGAVDLLVETSERLMLTATPNSIELSDDGLSYEVFTLDATAGTTYRFIVKMPAGNGVELQLKGADEFDFYYLNVPGGTRIAWDYQVEETGPLELSVRSYFFSYGDIFIVSVEVAE